MNTINVCIAGATGWAGSALSKGVFRQERMRLTGAVFRQYAGKNLAEALNLGEGNIPISGSLEAALETPCDVLVEYTEPAMAKRHIVSALNKGVNVVVGTSGLTESDYTEIERFRNCHWLLYRGFNRKGVGNCKKDRESECGYGRHRL